jgi:hypothetical protein
MKSADKIKQYFKKAELGINQDADEQVFADVLRARQKTTENEPAVPVNLWRIIMKSPLTKLAVAAVLLIACVTGVFIFNRTSGVAWAIEQSIEALSKYNAVLIEGSESFLDEDGKLQQMRTGKTWWVADEDQTRVIKERNDIDGVTVLIANAQETWRYDPQTNTVIKNRPYGLPEGWIGSRMLEQLQSFHDLGIITQWDITYGKDPVTRKQRAFLTVAWIDKRYNGPRSMWFEFDVQSKLVVSLKQWENANWEGPPRAVSEKITYYDNLPDELFEFEIPEGATVIEE